jgi:hypothetical protein
VQSLTAPLGLVRRSNGGMFGTMPLESPWLIISRSNRQSGQLRDSRQLRTMSSRRAPRVADTPSSLPTQHQSQKIRKPSGSSTTLKVRSGADGSCSSDSSLASGYLFGKFRSLEDGLANPIGSHPGFALHRAPQSPFGTLQIDANSRPVQQTADQSWECPLDQSSRELSV